MRFEVNFSRSWWAGGYPGAGPQTDVLLFYAFLPVDDWQYHLLPEAD
jgi:hypothetical protein